MAQELSALLFSIDDRFAFSVCVDSAFDVGTMWSYVGRYGHCGGALYIYDRRPFILYGNGFRSNANC